MLVTWDPDVVTDVSKVQLMLLSVPEGLDDSVATIWKRLHRLTIPLFDRYYQKEDYEHEFELAHDKPRRSQLFDHVECHY